jgi:hypothetical protein
MDIIRTLFISSLLCAIFSCVDVAWRWDTVHQSGDGPWTTSESVGILHGGFVFLTEDATSSNPPELLLAFHWPEFRPVFFSGGWWDCWVCGVSVLVAVPMMTAGGFIMWRTFRNWRQNPARDASAGSH